MSKKSDMKFIIWDPKDGNGSPRRDENGEFLSDGVVGRIPLNSVYLTIYGIKPDGAARYDSLEVGQCVRDVTFQMSGAKGIYDIYRVE